MSEHRDFAKIVRASDGRQVLFYVEPSGSDMLVNCVTDVGGFLATMKFEFKPPRESEEDFEQIDPSEAEHSAFAMLDGADQKTADLVIAEVMEMMGGVVQ